MSGIFCFRKLAQLLKKTIDLNLTESFFNNERGRKKMKTKN